MDMILRAIVFQRMSLTLHISPHVFCGSAEESPMTLRPWLKDVCCPFTPAKVEHDIISEGATPLELENHWRITMPG